MMDLFRVLKNYSKREHWDDGALWFGWTFVCGLLPLWASLLFLKLYSQTISLSILTENGAFALYSASYIGGCLYIVIHDLKRRSFPSKGILALIMVGLLLVSAFLFAQVSVSRLLDTLGISEPQKMLNRNLVSLLSWLLLPVVLLLSYLITVAENVRMSIDISELKRREIEDLNNDFDKLGDGNGK